jgi:hypothetical protein
VGHLAQPSRSSAAVPGVLTLGISALYQPLQRAQWCVMAIYVSYLLPYIIISYYDRYGLPLLGVKVLHVLWAVDRVATIWKENQKIPLFS